MKVKFKEVLDIEFNNQEGEIASQFLDKIITAVNPLETVTPAVPMQTIPLTNDEVLKQQERLKREISDKDYKIADLTNRLNQALGNYEAAKFKLEEANRKNSEWERQEELDDAYVKIKNLQAEITRLNAKVKELELKPNEYSTGMSEALVKSGLMSDEERQKHIDDVTLGRGVSTYYDTFTTYVDNYVKSPMLLTDFGKFNVVNCTPHPVTLAGKSGTVTIGPSDVCTRLEMDHKEAELPGSDLPLVVEAKGKLINVPLREKGTLYIVSRIVFDVSIDREDFICPNTIRANKVNGSVVSVPNFICRKELITKSQEENK